MAAIQSGIAGSESELDVASRITALASSFDSDPEWMAAELSAILTQSPYEFVMAALQVLVRVSGQPRAADAIAHLLNANELLISVLIDPRRSSHLEAAALCRAAGRVVPTLDIQLARQIRDDTDSQDPQELRRILELLNLISCGTRVVPRLIPLLRSESAWIRSKAVLLVGKAKRDPAWIEPYLADPDARTRSNAVEALWEAGGSRCVKLLLVAARDGHHRVMANACLALHKAGHPEAPGFLENMARKDLPEFRAAAAWAMGESGSQRFLPAIETLVHDANPAVRRSAIRAQASLRKNTLSGCGDWSTMVTS